MLETGQNTESEVKVFVIEPIIVIMVHLFLNNGNMTGFDKTHEVFAARQRGDNLIRGDLASRFHGTDVKIGVLGEGTSIGKEIGKKGPINLGDTLGTKSVAEDQSEVLERGKVL